MISFFVRCHLKGGSPLSSPGGDFRARFKKELEALAPGDPMDPKTTLGPLRTKAALELVEKQIKTAVDGGAKVLIGGIRVNRRGYFLQPTILTDVSRKNPAFQVEFFAPVAMTSASRMSKRLSIRPTILHMDWVGP